MAETINIDQRVGIELIQTKQLSNTELQMFCEKADKNDAQPIFYATAFKTGKFSTREMEKICLILETRYKDRPEIIALVYTPLFKTDGLSLKKIMKTCSRLNSQAICQAVLDAEILPHDSLIIIAKQMEGYDLSPDNLHNVWSQVIRQINWSSLKKRELFIIGMRANNEKIWFQVKEALSKLPK